MIKKVFLVGAVRAGILDWFSSEDFTSDDYLKQSAADKMNQLWGKLTEDETSENFPIPAGLLF